MKLEFKTSTYLYYLITKHILYETMENKISKTQIADFQAKILKWYSEFGRKFPWRKDNISHYDIVLAEVLLQRTKAETVDRFYRNFLIKYPSWKSLAETPIEIIETDLKPIGLYRQRAKRIKELAIELYKRDGIVPEDRESLNEIAMFGQYIANAVELQLFNRRKPLLDVNMSRVLERYFGPRELSDIRYDPYLQNLAHRVVNHENSKQISWAILDFASAICQSRHPKCATCLLSEFCKYYKINK